MSWVAPIVMILFGMLILYPVYKDVREAKGKKVIWIILEGIFLSTTVNWIGFLFLIFGIVILVSTVIKLF